MFKLFSKGTSARLKQYTKTAQSIIDLHTNTFSDISEEELPDLALRSLDNQVRLFAIIYEGVIRRMNMTPHKEQLIGALSIVDGNISEMKTGEGKTLTAAIAATYLAIMGRRVYVVTVNDYLVKRDSQEHAPLFGLFNIGLGSILSGMRFKDYKQAEYSSGIIYSTSSELAFDYLKDNLVYNLEDKVQKDLDFVIVDEIDSVLIDEATTPLIISEQVDGGTTNLILVNKIVKDLIEGVETPVTEGLQIVKKTSGDFILSRKERSVYLTEEGISKVEKALNVDHLYEGESAHYVVFIENAILANFYYADNVNYIVKDMNVVLIDESTGRLAEGRQLSEGLHQALEAKEGIQISPFTRTQGEISFQKFFKSFNTLSGMTGTASSEATEFKTIYELDIMTVPTHKPLIRNDKNDLLFLSFNAKITYFISEVKRIHAIGQPILIGTTSVETNELLEAALLNEGLSINVLNAKNADIEADIIAKAGEFSAITLATNMAGRGVDIKVTADSLAVGGLYVLGFERYLNRRIDNQLRGRSGRQGDPGDSQFFVSFEDELITIFGNNEKTKKVLSKLGFDENEVIDSAMLTRIVEKAQKGVEGQAYNSRLEMLKYDDTIGKQREQIFKVRNELLRPFDAAGKIEELLNFSVEKVFDYDGISEEAIKDNLVSLIGVTTSGEVPKDPEALKKFLASVIFSKFEDFKSDAEFLTKVVRHVYLQSLDRLWIEHLTEVDHLKAGISLRGYNQKDPVVEFQRETYGMYMRLFDNIKLDIMQNLIYLNIQKEN